MGYRAYTFILVSLLGVWGCGSSSSQIAPVSSELVIHVHDHFVSIQNCAAFPCSVSADISRLLLLPMMIASPKSIVLESNDRIVEFPLRGPRARGKLQAIFSFERREGENSIQISDRTGQLSPIVLNFD